MKIIFEPTPAQKPLSLEDVQVNQFFINKQGYLCQKVASISYNSIADELGDLYSAHFANQLSNVPIQRILPKAVKIEF